MKYGFVPRLVSATAFTALGAALALSLQVLAAGNGYRPASTPYNVAGTTAGMPPTAQTLWAVVDSTGAVLRSFPRTTTTATEPTRGIYEVTFYENVDACSYEATVTTTTTGTAYATVQAASGKPKTVQVQTHLTSGALADMPFNLAVHC